MIDEDRTMQLYGYTSDELKPRSSKPIVRVCEICGQYKILPKQLCRELCRSCAVGTKATRCKMSESHKGSKNHFFGKHHTEESKTKIGLANTGHRHTEDAKRKISNAVSGKNNPFFGKHHTKETRDRLSEVNSNPSAKTRQQISDNHADVAGCNNPAWKGGVTAWRGVLMHSKVYKNWRTTVFERDGYTCALCGDSVGGNLQAHHIRPVRDHRNDLAIYDVNNGITLCETCHDLVNGHEYSYANMFENILRGI